MSVNCDDQLSSDIYSCSYMIIMFQTNVFQTASLSQAVSQAVIMKRLFVILFLLLFMIWRYLAGDCECWVTGNISSCLIEAETW